MRARVLRHPRATIVGTNAQLLRRENAAMPGNQRALFVDEHRDGPAPFPNRGRDLRYLLVGMRSGIAGTRDQLRERPALYLVRGPCFRSKFPSLARAHHARARQWGIWPIRVASSASISAASATAASSTGQAAVHLFDQVLDSDMPPELAAIGVMMLVDAKMRAEPIEHLNDLGCLPFGKQVDL